MITEIIYYCSTGTDKQRKDEWGNTLLGNALVKLNGKQIRKMLKIKRTPDNLVVYLDIPEVGETDIYSQASETTREELANLLIEIASTAEICGSGTIRYAPLDKFHDVFVNRAWLEQCGATPGEITQFIIKYGSERLIPGKMLCELIGIERAEVLLENAPESYKKGVLTPRRPGIKYESLPTTIEEPQRKENKIAEIADMISQEIDNFLNS